MYIVKGLELSKHYHGFHVRSFYEQRGSTFLALRCENSPRTWETMPQIPLFRYHEEDFPQDPTKPPLTYPFSICYREGSKIPVPFEPPHIVRESICSVNGENIPRPSPCQLTIYPTLRLSFHSPLKPIFVSHNHAIIYPLIISSFHHQMCNLEPLNSSNKSTAQSHKSRKRCPAPANQ